MAEDIRGQIPSLREVGLMEEDKPKYPGLTFSAILWWNLTIAFLRFSIVNNICSKALSHRQFKALLDKMDAQYGDVLYHREVRWLSRGKVLRHFFELREEIGAFQATKKNNIQVPSNKHWTSDLAFLMDIT